MTQGPTRAEADTRALSFTHVEEMDAREYWAYIYEGLAKITEGHAWGERLRAFMQENAHFATVQEIESTNARRSGNLFFVSVHPPSARGTEYYYRDDYHALMIPKIPIDQIIAGAILAHELQHAYDRSMSEETEERTFTNSSFIEMQAYLLSMDLLDHYLDGRFRQVLQMVLDEKEYDRTGTGRLLYTPDKKGRARLDALFGYPSPWENLLREPLYVTSLSYQAAGDNPVERTYATAMYKQWAFLAMRDYYSHVGTHRSAVPGEDLTSPIDGRVLRHESSRQEGDPTEGIVLEGAGPDSARTVRILAVHPTAAVGTIVSRGDVIGQVQDPGEAARTRDPWIHIEVYENGRRVDATTLAERAWPERGPSRASLLPEDLKTRNAKVQKALDAELEREWDRAIMLYEEAIATIVSGYPSTLLRHCIARSYANMGEYARAASVQQELVDTLEAETFYAKKEFPPAGIGTNGFALTGESTEIWLRHMRANLEAYRAGRNTAYVY